MAASSIAPRRTRASEGGADRAGCNQPDGPFLFDIDRALRMGHIAWRESEQFDSRYRRRSLLSHMQRTPCTRTGCKDRNSQSCRAVRMLCPSKSGSSANTGPRARWRPGRDAWARSPPPEAHKPPLATRCGRGRGRVTRRSRRDTPRTSGHWERRRRSSARCRGPVEVRTRVTHAQDLVAPPPQFAPETSAPPQQPFLPPSSRPWRRRGRGVNAVDIRRGGP